jgi:hypothetical protein
MSQLVYPAPLKLESGEGPLDILVVDHAEKPSGN